MTEPTLPHLPDTELLEFLSAGYVVVEPGSMSAEDHERLWQRADELHGTVNEGNARTAHLEILGDNLRASIPEIDQMLNDPQVAGAIESILGKHAFLHPHSFLHQSQRTDQPFHQDGNLPWNERGHYRSHRPDWVIMFYYPQAVTLDNGPTEVLPGTQYWTTDIEQADDTWRAGDPIDPDLDRAVLADEDLNLRDEALAASLEKLGVPGLERRFVQVPAGSVVIGNYDLIHRGSRTGSGQPPRYMFKFYYARTQEPELRENRPLPPLAGLRDDLAPVVAGNWSWLNGARRRVSLRAADIELDGKLLVKGEENDKVAAAYRLGADTSRASLDLLLAGLRHEAEAVRRASAYGLRQRCDEVGAELADAARDEQVSVRRFAIFSLGAVWSPGADALLDRLENEPDDLARSNAAYALGQLARCPGIDADSVLNLLLARLQPGVEPDNTTIAGLPRSTVRQSVGYAILQLACNHRLGDDVRREMSTLLRRESDRYVLGMLVEALAAGSADADVIRALNARRWSVARG